MLTQLPVLTKTAVLAVVPLLLTLAVIQVLIKPARRIGLVDRPGGRKEHDGEIPLIGGLGMAIALILSVQLAEPQTLIGLNVLGSIALLVVVGVLDDFLDIRAKTKLLVQAIAAMLIVLPSGVYITHVGDILGIGNISLGPLALPFTVFAVVGLINAVNMADGADGLAAGLTSTTVVWFIACALVVGNQSMALDLVILLAVTVGFLCYNMRTPLRHKAAVFMGDAGSMMLGALLAWFAIQLPHNSTAVPPPPPFAILWMLGLPVLDTVVLMIRRMLQGRSPFSAGRDHMHHIWMHAGFSPGETTLLLMLLNALIGLVGFAGWRSGVPEWALALGYVGLFAIQASITQHAWVVSKWLKRHHCARTPQ